MTGDVAMVPTLSGKEFPGDDYACAILTGDDLDVPLCSPSFFRLLIVYGRRGFTALRSFSSDTGSWGPECKKPGAKISGHVLRQLGPAVVLHGVAYWPMNRAAFGVRLGSTAAAAAAIMDVCSVPYRYRLTNWKPDEDYRRPRGAHNSLLNLTVLEDAVGYKSTTTSVDRSDEDISIDLPQIKATRTTPMKPWWFGEKSGTLIFTVEETSSTSAVFALNVATRSLEKLADGVSNHTCCRRLYGYEMDRAALLASVAPQ
ncbi:unnamed protein product [Miscanthus lutarioriparius]|uniref:Uncharacterized protein n=1 Tax=Miscanthus lutarioriparius TaxID=422564 RepID=A0A811SQ80_9POAL|nr:unnamed protein product [Miscanthus lutarioriparius]